MISARSSSPGAKRPVDSLCAIAKPSLERFGSCNAPLRSALSAKPCAH
ncbi:Uncharacterised protein [Vibrio cholerae]|nr:Uncharacterised protein [Vibrio cholerae]